MKRFIFILLLFASSAYAQDYVGGTRSVLRLPVTVANCENTAVETAIISFTVPANSLTDGSYIHITYTDSSSQNDATLPTLTTKMYWGASSIQTSSGSPPQSATVGFTQRQWYIYRNGSELDFASTAPSTLALNSTAAFTANNAQIMGGGGIIQSLTFTSATTLAMKITWSAAKATAWVRMVAATAELYTK